jgi:predicted xylose isomerase-like sugar epimerase
MGRSYKTGLGAPQALLHITTTSWIFKIVSDQLTCVKDAAAVDEVRYEFGVVADFLHFDTQTYLVLIAENNMSGLVHLSKLADTRQKGQDRC